MLHIAIKPIRRGLVSALIGALVASCSPAPTPRVSRVIYDQDNRQNIGQGLSPLVLERVRAVAAVVLSQQLVPASTPDAFNLLPFAELGLGNLPIPQCTDNRFHEQPAVALATSVLVGPDLLLTAAHTLALPPSCAQNLGCPEALVKCAELAFVFDFVEAATSSADQIYRCKKIEVFEPRDAIGKDWALIRLERTVVGRTPVPLSDLLPSQILSGTPVFTLGFPEGRPMKLADEAEVKYTEGFMIRTNTDTFGGNSGSPLFNEAGNLLGVLSRGTQDYELRTQANGEQCLAPRICTAESPCTRYEAYTSILQARGAIQSALAAGR